MLVKIEIHNFILIDSLVLKASPGMTVMTGETGAGKSILLGALGAALGQRISAKSVLKNPEKKAIIELVFQVGDDLKALFESLDIDFDRESVFRRELLPSGKSRSFINDTPVKATVLAQLADRFIDINSQNDGGLLYRTEEQLELIDAFGDIDSVRDSYQRLFTSYSKVLGSIKVLESLDGTEDLDYLQFVLGELDQIKLKPGEYDQLDDDLRTARLLAGQREGFESLIQRLDAPDALLDQLFGLEAQLDKLAKEDDRWDEDLKDTLAFIRTMEELKSRARGVLDQAEVEDFEGLQERKSKIDAALRKHRVASDVALIEKTEEIRAKVEQLLHKETELQRLIQERDRLYQEVVVAGEALQDVRANASQSIQSSFETYLERVDLPKARLLLDWTPTTPTRLGTFNPTFLFAANPGSKLEPLHKVASGGEQSRVKLAMKAVLGAHKTLSTQIFDEIDTGISGSTAEKVGQLMREMATKQQIIAITHLPQVASSGSTHWKVEKNQTESTTTSSVSELSFEQRATEIARLLSGERITEAAKKQALALLNER